MKFQRLIPLLFIILGMFLVYWLDLIQYMSFEELKRNRNLLKQLVAENSLLAPLSYIMLYIIVAGLSIPGAIFVTLTGGFLFPQPYSTIYTVIGSSIGATCLFLAARYALADVLRHAAGPTIYKLKKGLEDNAASYLLFLRFIPLFPFWLVNLAPALFGVSLFTFIWTTVVGVFPGSFVFCQAGAGLDAIFNNNQEFHIGAILNTNMKIALVGLAIFSLLPLLLKKLGFFPKNSTPEE